MIICNLFAVINIEIRKIIDREIVKICTNLANMILAEVLELFAEQQKVEGNIREIVYCITRQPKDICNVLESKGNVDFVKQLLLLSHAAFTFSKGGMKQIRNLQVIIYILFICYNLVFIYLIIHNYCCCDII